MPTARNSRRTLFDAIMLGIAKRQMAEITQLRVYAFALPNLSEYTPVPTLPMALIAPPKEASIQAFARRKGMPLAVVANIPAAFAIMRSPDWVEPMNSTTRA